jgi:hypothetical protein
MKLKDKFLVLISLPLLLLTACEKTTDDVSRIVKVTFPGIALNGNEIVPLKVGASYTDAGAKLTDDISGAVTDIQPTASNVNTAAPGLYVVTFLAANANGFETSVSRRVAVTSVTGTPDRSGNYLRAATGLTCVITKVADGVYKVVNPGGAAAGVNTVVYFVETAPNVFVCPPQPFDEPGSFSVININFTATGVSWNVSAPGYGTGLRTFTK